MNYEEPAQCGFNSDDKAYCNKHIGDDDMVKLIADLTVILRKDYKCHFNHRFIYDATKSVFNCADLLKNEKASEVAKFHQLSYLINQGGYARVANNPSCVKKTITHSYWKVRTGEMDEEISEVQE